MMGIKKSGIPCEGEVVILGTDSLVDQPCWDVRCGTACRACFKTIETEGDNP